MSRRRKKKDSPIKTVFLIIMAAIIMMAAVYVIMSVVGKIRSDYKNLDFTTEEKELSLIHISCALSLPFEYIKLDRSLLVRLPGDSKVQVFVRSMVETFHAMGQKIVAEGVEEEEQIELLRQFGVDCVQGYYYGKPMPEDEFRAAVAKGWEEQRRCCLLYTSRCV